MPKKPIAAFLTDTHLKESNHKLVKSIFKQAKKKVLELGLKELFHLGDVYDSRKAQTEENLRCFTNILVELSGVLPEYQPITDEGIDFYAIPGNHDKPDYSSINSFLDQAAFSPLLKGEESRFFHLFKMPTAIERDGVVFHFCPFFADNIYVSVLSEYCKNYKFDRKKKHILLTHIEFTGAISNDGDELKGMNKDLVKDFDLVLVGHIHDYQELYGGKVIYIGSGYQGNFGENNKKGLTVLYDDLSIQQVKLDFPEYINYELKATEVNSAVIEQLEKQKKESGDNIKIHLTGKKEEVDAINKQALLNVGLKVEKKADILIKADVEAQVEKLDTSKIAEIFPLFCTERDIKDSPVGIEFLKRAKIC